MRKLVALTLSLALVGFVIAPESKVYSQKREKSKSLYVDNQILVKLKADVDLAADAREMAEFVARPHGLSLEPLRAQNRGALYRVELDGSLSVEEAVERMSVDPRVEYAEPNYLLYPSTMPNDSLFTQQWSLMNTGAFGTGKPGADISATHAWDLTTGSNDMVVAVIDTGVDLSHTDLAPNAWVNSRENPNNGVDDDNNGYVDDRNGWNFVSNRPVTYEDSSADWHGTHVSGTIGAAGNNGIGVTGIAWRVKIMSLKFIGVSTGSTADAVKAINYVMDQKKRGVNVRVINSSWGGSNNSATLKSAIVSAGNAGILFVCAAGNGGDDQSGDDLADAPYYPAAWSAEISSVIAVAAVDYTDRKADFTNYGYNTVQVGAPGVNTFSTAPDGQYGYGAGTSMATPHVSGVAALLFSREPELSPSQARQRIVSTADPLPTLAGRVEGSGRVNAYNALTNTTQQAPQQPAIGYMSSDKKKVKIDGIGFVKGVSVVEVNGVSLPKLKYDSSRRLADGSVIEMSAKLGKSGMLATFPKGTSVTVTVFNPTTGERSEPFTYTK
ncbi:MAG TPA: S8 family peptidase [Blastocatellia bacterium]|nr:S8 family peptidase [Blastocatellia bacterium]